MPYNSAVRQQMGQRTSYLMAECTKKLVVSALSTVDGEQITERSLEK
jgi:hypothetical protein